MLCATPAGTNPDHDPHPALKEHAMRDTGWN
jgi:hypothetical protein